MVNLFGKKQKNEQDSSENQIISAIDEAHSSGILKKNEAEMIQNVIDFSDTDAREIMTHRSDIKAVEGSATLKDTVTMMLSGTNSRMPVYEGTIDSILGIITMKDVMKEYVFHPEKRNFAIGDIRGLIREATIFPETRSIESILQYMRSRKIQMVIVVDEYGQTSGLVAMEDILEEIVGNILDEYDADDTRIPQKYGNIVLLDGMTPLDQAAEVLHVKLGPEAEDFETLNGYLTARLGHIPTEKDKVVTGKYFLFHILKVENHTIKKVKAERLPAEEEKE